MHWNFFTAKCVEIKKFLYNINNMMKTTKLEFILGFSKDEKIELVRNFHRN